MSLWSKVMVTPVTYSDEEQKIMAASRSIGLTITVFGALGLIFIFVWADGIVSHIPKDTPSLGWSAFVGADLLAAAAASAAGALLGFIFAIPRTLDPATGVVVAGAAAQDPATATHTVLAANTNLERISDWLTTLLIGATLVQIKDIAAWVGALGQHLVAVGAAANDAIVPIIVIYYFALAFLGIYLITRLYLTSAFQAQLGVLAGGRQPGAALSQRMQTSDLAAESAKPDDPRAPLSQLKKTLDDAAESAKPDDLKAALDSHDNWTFSGNERDDPDLNAKLARVLCKAIETGATASRKGDAHADLKKACAKAATDAAIKAQLKTEADSGTFGTGDAALDSEISTILA